MSFSAVEKIADAVLFEGYMLYPYRPSSIKNQKRWNFGTLFPRSLVETQEVSEASHLHTEVLVQAPSTGTVVIRVRFLELVSPEGTGDQDWQQGFIRMRGLGANLEDMINGLERSLDLGTLNEEERHRVPAARKQQTMIGRLSVHAERLAKELFRLKIEFANESPARGAPFVSAHLLLHVDGGSFVSLLDPEEKLKDIAGECTQQGVFPVLAGEPGSHSSLLCSPIILYDYPEVAGESAGNFFDSTEMDEMLALRVMTLTEEEKAEMRRSDPHARAILERTETLPADHLLKIHGAVRAMRSAPEVSSPEVDARIEAWDPFAERPPVEVVRVFGVEVRKGDRVRLWPQKQADIIDMAMEGKVAIVEAIEQDLEDRVQFAVVLEDDPGKDIGMLRQAGHRFFYSPEEIEPLSTGSTRVRD